MDGHLREDVVYVGGDARQRFYDSRGYGRPLHDDERADWGRNGLALSPVEAAHLLERSDLEAVVDDGRNLGFRAFLARAGRRPTDSTGFLVRYLVYADLRGRGFYLSPARPDWPGSPADADYDFAVYERGAGPGENRVEHRMTALGERETVRVASLDGDVLAVVDEESDVTYFDTSVPDVTGSSGMDLPERVPGELLADRALVWDPPGDLYRRGFFGQPLTDHDAGTALQLSLVEAAFLSARGTVSFDAVDSSLDPAEYPLAASGPGFGAVLERGLAVEGDRFDRRLRTYAALRERGVVPKTGFKFGADFRTYADVEDVEDLGHSELLVRALPADRTVTPRDLALDVRLAHGVRKRMVFALVGDDDIAWRSASRLTP
jgi:tRNA-intron endonuclease